MVFEYDYREDPFKNPRPLFVYKIESIPFPFIQLNLYNLSQVFFFFFSSFPLRRILNRIRLFIAIIMICCFNSFSKFGFAWSSWIYFWFIYSHTIFSVVVSTYIDDDRTVVLQNYKSIIIRCVVIWRHDRRIAIAWKKREREKEWGWARVGRGVWESKGRTKHINRMLCIELTLPNWFRDVSKCLIYKT